MVLTIIPAERGHKMSHRVKEAQVAYDAPLTDLLDHSPMP